MAGWQSGYAAACKAVDAGSIPTPASIIKKTMSDWTWFFCALSKYHIPREFVGILYNLCFESLLVINNALLNY